MGLKHTAFCSIDGCAKPFFARGLCKNHHAEKTRRGELDRYPRSSTEKGENVAFLRAHAAHKADSCLVWPYAWGSDGYGQLRDGKKKLLAHRVMCQLVHGKPPRGAHAAHSCGNPRCVNPQHLRWATVRENMHDKWDHGTMVRGERMHTNKLTEQQVLSIYKDARIEKEIAAEYGVAKSTINFIRSGRTWAWLTGHRQIHRVNGKWEDAARIGKQGQWV